MIKCFLCKKDISKSDIEIGEPANGWVVITQVWEDDTNWANEEALCKGCATKVLPKELMKAIWTE